MFLLKYFSNKSRRESGPDTALASPSANEVELQPAKRQKIISKAENGTKTLLIMDFAAQLVKRIISILLPSVFFVQPVLAILMSLSQSF